MFKLMTKSSYELNSSINRHMLTPSTSHTLDGFDSSDTETWLYHQVYNKDKTGYAMQLNTIGTVEMWKTIDNGASWNNVWAKNVLNSTKWKLIGYKSGGEIVTFDISQYEELLFIAKATDNSTYQTTIPADFIKNQPQSFSITGGCLSGSAYLCVLSVQIDKAWISTLAIENINYIESSSLWVYGR